MGNCNISATVGKNNIKSSVSPEDIGASVDDENIDSAVASDGINSSVADQSINSKIDATVNITEQAMQVDRLTAQCNGVLKLFTLTENFVSGKILLVGTQFPDTYDPTVDFTEVPPNQILLTDAVGAPATGQTLIATYAVE